MANKKKCPNCQKFVSPTATFCVFCGEPFDNVEEDEDSMENDTPKFVPVAPKAVSEPESTPPKPEESPKVMEPVAPSHKQTATPVMKAETTAKKPEKDIIREDDPTEDDGIDNSAFEKMLSYSIQEDDPEDEAESADEDKSDPVTDETPKPEKRASFFSKALKPKELLQASEKPKQKKVKQESPAPAKTDAYYDNLLGLVDAECEHVAIQNVIRTVSLGVIFVLIVLFCLFR